MSKLPTVMVLSSLLVILALPWAAGAATGVTTSGIQATPTAPTTPVEQESWIWLDLPPDATQLLHGQEVYRLVCSACHAYDGTGLTDEWRSTWNPDDQNCWQSKCHAENHPPDGFFLPYSPAVVGPVIPALFETAYDLYEYNRSKMPWHNPNSMTDEEYWAVTAYVLKLNGFDPGPHLDADTAHQIRLRPVGVAPTPTQTEQALPSPTVTTAPTPEPASEARVGPPGGWVGLGITLATLGALVGYLVLRRRS